MNLLDETVEKLRQHNKTIFDVLWFGTRSKQWGADIQTLFNIEYDAGFGRVYVPEDLIVVGDNWWLERHEYDGSEWWEFKSMPAKPEAVIHAVPPLN
jgi:hypothetical protein